MRTVLFICTGNTCRSPLAEGIARGQLASGTVAGLGTEDLFVASAGVHASNGSPMSHETARALERRGLPTDGTSKQLSPEMIEKADLVLGMTQSHVDMARRLLGNQDVLVERLDPAGDLEDPIGLGEDVYERLAKRLEAVIPRRLEELLT
ncbi:MAG: hypothetical protein MK085_06350 [Phycisphaerales bacterium]|nr:hypothetical protein [Phycisphaerales bacterium]